MYKVAVTPAAKLRVRYRGYNIEVCPDRSGWRGGVFPSSADLPILYRADLRADDQDEAVIEAMDRVDRVLRSLGHA
jgi:hypothetical protein